MRGFVLLIAMFCMFCASVGAGPSSVPNASIKNHVNPRENPQTPKDEPPPPTEGDPVGLFDGNVYETVTDIRIPCPDIDLVFRRSYGSWSMDTGALGYGWTHSYDWRLLPYEDYVIVLSAGENGASDAVHTFMLPGTNDCVFNADGYGLRKLDLGGYDLITPDAYTYSFASNGTLESVSAWNGTKISMVRDADTGVLRRVVHDNGKFLAFEYDGSGFITQVRTQDPNVWISTKVGPYEVASEAALGDSDLFMTLDEVVLHYNGGAATNVYAYTNSPPGIRYVKKGSGRSPPWICSGPPPTEELVTEGIRPVLWIKTDKNDLSTQYRYVRPDEMTKCKAKNFAETAECTITLMHFSLLPSRS